MPGTDLRSIPLPSQSIQERPSQKMSAKEILQKALREHKSAKKETDRDGPASAPDPPAKMESSQHIVDELFKDFISKKMTKTVKTSSGQADFGIPGKDMTSISEMSKLLDMEISSIQAQTKDVSGTGQKETKASDDGKHKLTAANPKPERKRTSSENMSDLNASSRKDLKQSSSSSDIDSCPSVKHVQLPEPCQLSHQNKPKKGGTENMSSEEALSESKLGQAALLPNKVISNTNSLTKKTSGPKQLGCKLSLESLNLIQSTDKVDRDGRVWEEGEVPSSHSEGSDKVDEESDTDIGDVSDTGSIASNNADSKHHSSNSKHKKKHKHKHKKKKKKSNRDRDKSKHKSSDSDKKKEGSRDKGKGKNEKKGDQDATASGSKSCEDDGKEEKKTDTVSDDTVTTPGPTVKEKTRHDDKSSSKERDDSKKGEKSKKRKRDRSRSPKHGRKSKSKSRSRSRSPKKHKKDSSPHRSSAQSQFNEWDARHYGDQPSKTARGRSHSPESKGKSSSRKRSRSRDDDKDLRLKIDKAKLRKIAIANALNNLKSGQGPQLDVVTVKAGGKSVEELTDFCKRISEKDRDNDVSDSSDEDPATKSNEDDDDELPIHHPFKVKDTTSNIVMNIRNAKQLPILTPTEKQAQQAALRLTFPVSSGSHHRASESEWVPVERTKPITSTSTSKAVTSQASIDNQKKEEPKGVFNVPKEKPNIDIGSIISERLSAVRKLQENPYDVQALSTIHKAQERATQWATSKHLPGQFMGTTGAKVLSQAELIGNRHHQAWAKKSQFTSAAPINGGIGLYLLQKMGWKQGEGLGKHNEGSKEPLQLDVKVDRKGLTTPLENPKAKAQIINVPRAKDLSTKHPVSALMEMCNRRRWGAPMFTIVLEDGPDHKKNFLFKVKVNNVEYQPTVPSSNKKSAKALCAAVCLQEMGLLPRDAPMNY